MNSRLQMQKLQLELVWDYKSYYKHIAYEHVLYRALIISVHKVLNELIHGEIDGWSESDVI